MEYPAPPERYECLLPGQNRCSPKPDTSPGAISGPRPPELQPRPKRTHSLLLLVIKLWRNNPERLALALRQDGGDDSREQGQQFLASLVHLPSGKIILFVVVAEEV